MYICVLRIKCMHNAAVRAQSNSGPLTPLSPSCHYRKTQSRIPPLMLETRGYQHKPGYAASSRNSGQDSRRSEQKLVLKSGRMWNWVCELKAAMGGEKKMCTRMKASAGPTRRNRQPSEVWIQIAVQHAAVCLLAQTCPCVRRMVDEGSGDFMASVKATCIQVQGLCGQRPERATTESGWTRKIRGRAEGTASKKYWKGVFLCGRSRSSMSHLKGPVGMKIIIAENWALILRYRAGPPALHGVLSCFCSSGNVLVPERRE